MSKRIVLFGMLSVLAGMSASACEVIGGLQKATLSEIGGGGQGGSATTSSGGTTSATVCDPGMKIDCYTGEVGTQDKGICHGGKQICEPDGSGYGACEEEQTPGDETCAGTDDEDCDGNDCARWAVVYGDPAEQRPLGIAVDGLGNVYVLGAFKGALPVVNPALVSSGQEDLFLLKLSPVGKVLWVRQFGDAAAQSDGKLAVDAAGNVAIAAPFDGVVDFGKGDLGPGGTAIVSLDTDGNTLWSIPIASKLQGHVALNKDSDIIYWTTFSGKVDFGKGQFDAVQFSDLALVKFNARDGATVWAKQYGYAGNKDEAEGLAIDGGNNIVVCGSYNPTIDLGGGDLMKTNSGFSELFVARFDKNGSYSAAGSYPNLESAGVMALDSLGSAALSYIEQTAGNPEAYSTVLQKVDNMVMEVWTKSFKDASGGGNDTILTSMSFDSTDNLAVVFTAVGKNSLGGADLAPIGMQDLVLAKLNAGGNHLWSRRFGAAGQTQTSPVIATAPNGDIVMAAEVSGTINVGTGPLPTNGQDLLIARFAP